MRTSYRYLLLILFLTTITITNNSLVVLGQTNKNNELYSLIVTAFNNYYDSVIVVNPAISKTIGIDINGLPLGFNFDSIHASNLFSSTLFSTNSKNNRRLLKKGLSLINIEYHLGDSSIQIVLYRKLFVLSKKKLLSSIQDSSSLYFEASNNGWMKSANRNNLKDTMNSLLVYCINHLDSCKSVHSPFETSKESYLNAEHFQIGFPFNKVRIEPIRYDQIRKNHKNNTIGVWDLSIYLNYPSLIISFRPTSIKYKRTKFYNIVNNEDIFAYEFIYSSPHKQWELVRIRNPFNG